MRTTQIPKANSSISKVALFASNWASQRFHGSFSAKLTLALSVAVALIIALPVAYATTFLSDDFAGTTINTSKWIEHDSGTNVNQNNGLTIVGNGAFSQNGLESQASFSRTGLTIISTARASSSANDYLPLEYGDWSWLTSGTSTYFVYFKGNGGIDLRYFNNGSQVQSISAGTYSASTTYHLKLVLQATGADLYIDSGSGYPGSPSASLTQGTFTNKKVNAETFQSTATLTLTNINVSDGVAALPNVTSLSITPGANQNAFSWINPSTGSPTGTMIRYRTDTYPTSPTNGTLVTDQAGGTGATQSYTHTGLGGGTTYYYTLFAHNGTPAYATGATISATPTGAPGNVTGFSATPGLLNMALAWTNPTSATLTHVVIRYRTDTYPTSATDGTLVVDRSATSGSADSYTHTGLTEGTTYYYRAFAANAIPQYASGATASATAINYALDDEFSANGLDTSLWSAVGNSVTQTGAGIANIGAASPNNWNRSGITSVNTFSRSNLVITTRAKFSSSSTYASPLAYGDPDAGRLGGSGRLIWIVPSGGTFHCFYSVNGPTVEDLNSGIAIAANTYYTFRLTLDATSGGTFAVDSGSGFQTACTVAGGTFTNKPISLQSYSTPSLTVDYVRAAGSLGATAVTFASPTANRTIHGDFYDFAIPWIQTSTSLAVTASGTNIPVGGGIQFVLDEGAGSQASLTDLSRPYSVTFSGLAKGEHTLKAYALQGDGTTRVGGGPQASLSSIGIGDILVAIGDSTTAGYYGNSTSGNVTTCAQASYKTADCRTYEQKPGDGGGTFASYHVDLATKMENYYGYPVFIMNEGWSGSDTYHFNGVIAPSTAFQNRMNDLQPTRFLVNYGVNDARCESGSCLYPAPSGQNTAAAFQTRLQTLIDTLKTYGVPNSRIFLARYSYDTSLTAYASGYLSAIATVLANNSGLQRGADIYDFISNHLSYIVDVTHPSAAGFAQEARVWSIAMMQPQNPSVSQSGGTVTVRWNNLALTEPTINGYKVKYGTSSGSYTTTVDAGNVTSRAVTGLTNGQTYYFAVSAYDNDPSLVNESLNSQQVALTYTLPSATTALASSANPSTFGNSITLTATVSPSSATGSLAFKDGSTTIGTITLSHGSGSLATSSLSAGSHSLTAVYAGNSSYTGSTSNTVTQIVNTATSTTALASSANPSTFGNSITLTATVSPSSATGSLAFKDGSTTIGTITLSHGSGSLATSSLSAGSHSLTAVYAGNSSYTGSTTSGLTQVVSTVASSSSSSNASSSSSPDATPIAGGSRGHGTIYSSITVHGRGTFLSASSSSRSSSRSAVSSRRHPSSNVSSSSASSVNSKSASEMPPLAHDFPENTYVVLPYALKFRSGPRMDSPVKTTLPQGAKLIVEYVVADTWAKVRVPETGREGFVAVKQLKKMP